MGLAHITAETIVEGSPRRAEPVRPISSFVGLPSVSLAILLGTSRRKLNICGSWQACKLKLHTSVHPALPSGNNYRVFWSFAAEMEIAYG